jgi:hypothetical protein
MERIEMLKSWIETDPKDPFNYYGLALEYQKLGDPQADQLFEKLLIDFSDYLPTYYTAAKYYENSDANKAKLIYEKGMILANNQNSTKTLNELRSALQNFIFESE